MRGLIFSPYKNYPREYVKLNPCECGKNWTVSGEYFRFIGIRPVTQLTIECAGCNNSRILQFDQSSHYCKC
ncbi:MAG: hypothetical protein ACFFCS_27170 [Candidatus Hodarchaeota archaeon]